MPETPLCQGSPWRKPHGPSTVPGGHRTHLLDDVLARDILNDSCRGHTGRRRPWPTRGGLAGGAGGAGREAGHCEPGPLPAGRHHRGFDWNRGHDCLGQRTAGGQIRHGDKNMEPPGHAGRGHFQRTFTFGLTFLQRAGGTEANTAPASPQRAGPENSPLPWGSASRQPEEPLRLGSGLGHLPHSRAPPVPRAPLPSRGSAPGPLTWGTTLVCVVVAVGARIWGMGGTGGSACVGPAGGCGVAGRLGWATTRTWGSPLGAA